MERAGFRDSGFGFRGSGLGPDDNPQTHFGVRVSPTLHCLPAHRKPPPPHDPTVGLYLGPYTTVDLYLVPYGGPRRGGV